MLIERAVGPSPESLGELIAYQALDCEARLRPRPVGSGSICPSCTASLSVRCAHETRL